MARYISNIILWIIALMTGVLSIFREVMAIFKPEQAPPRSLFWSCIIIAYIISAAILWLREHHKAKKNRPKLNADVNVFAVAPVGTNDNDSLVVINAAVFNTGAPTVIHKVSVCIKKGALSFIGEPLIPTQELGLLGEGLSFSISAEDLFERKCLAQPIPTAGAERGSIVRLFPGLKRADVFEKGTLVELSFQDAFEKKYRFQKEMSGARIPPKDITRLQRPRS